MTHFYNKKYTQYEKSGLNLIFGIILKFTGKPTEFYIQSSLYCLYFTLSNLNLIVCYAGAGFSYKMCKFDTLFRLK